MAWFRKPKYTTIQQPPVQRSRIPAGLWTKCPACLETVIRKDWDEAFGVCPQCGYHARLGARDRIRQLLDEGSFVETDDDLTPGDPLEFKDSKTYIERLEQAREKTGLDEACLCGTGRIEGNRVSIAVMDAHFIGGSMGEVVGEKVARAMERGLEQTLPVILVCASGGARMQEGAVSLMQMAKTGAVAGRLHRAGLPLITILTDPTTGGVTASFAMLGDIIVAEPKALIGFAGPRVIEATIKQILPPGFQKSEFVADHGFIDLVSPRMELREKLGRLLPILMHAHTGRKRTASQSKAEPKVLAGKVSGGA